MAQHVSRPHLFQYYHYLLLQEPDSLQRAILALFHHVVVTLPAPARGSFTLGGYFSLLISRAW